MRRLPNSLYRAEQVREFDRMAIEEQGIPGAELMERAGKAAFNALREAWPRARRIAVLAGIGNNGGDAYVVARLAYGAGLEVRLWQVGDANKLKGEALSMARLWRDAGGETQEYKMGLDLGGSDVVVDGLLGTGLNADLQGDWADAVRAINDSHASVLALDIPSGLHADTGCAMGCAVKAQLTVTFIALKQGLFTGTGPRYCGQVVYDDLRVPPKVLMSQAPSVSRLTFDGVVHLLAPRRRDAHKGDFGHVLIIGGDAGMGGAVRMAAEATLRVGAGLVSVATRPVHAAVISAARPELMCHAVTSASELRPLLARAGVVAIGPGLGQSDWAQELLGSVLGSGLPMVVDADALNLLAIEPLQRDNWILTPHPGEAGRLLHKISKDIQADRFAAVKALQEQFGGVVVLKGAGSLVAAADSPLALCDAGNPGMASGGMGDVLTGVIAGLLAQRQTLKTDPAQALAVAARLGVSVHARAADIAANEGGERGLLASDVIAALREVVNPAQF
jgi:NAD(P)H-hydrate epimerase